MILTREKGKRMWGGLFSETSGSGGGEGGSGGVTPAWIDSTYISKEFFNQLFVVHINTQVLVKDGDEVISDNTTAGTLSPNDIIPAESTVETDPETGYEITTTVTLASIEATTNFWSSLAISALGNGTGGGGGTVLLEPLLSINNSGLSAPGASQDGKTIVWDNATGKWKYGAAGGGGGTVTSITAGTGLSGGTITSSGTIAISTAYQGYINEGHTAYRWGNHANAGYLTSINATMINSALGFTLSGTSGATYNLASFLTAITSQMVTNALGFTPVSNATTWWGRSVNNNAVVGHIDMNNGDAVRFKANGGDGAYWNCLTMNTSNTLSLGYYIRTHNQSLQLEGGTIRFSVNQNSGSATTPSDNPLEAAYFSTNGLLTLNRGLYTPGVFTDANNYTGIRIGGAMLSWDSNNNALKVHAYDSANGSVDFYSTGGVSALGQSSGGGGGGASSTLSQSYSMPYTGTSGTTYYWHKLGSYQMDTAAMCLVIDLFSGSGYNGNASQNSWARITIKKSNTTSGTSGAVGITCEQFGRQISDGKILVRVSASAYNKGDVYVKCPWGYPKGAYTVQGDYTAWEHNDSATGDTTTAPTHNQNAVGYYDNTTTMTSGE